MAEQGRTTGGATGSRGQLTGDPVKLCNTSYREYYGQRVQDQGQRNFSSYLGHPSGTGFTANHRPAIYYKPSLDRIDNPQLGLLLSDNYMSQMKRHYQPHIQSDYNLWSLPNLINKPRQSGFHQLKCHPKTATAGEKTEYQSFFGPPPLTPKVFQSLVAMGPKVESGFTEGTDLQLNTFQDKSCIVEPQQNHSSVMKSDFKTPSLLQGTEARLSLCSFSSRETGFTRGTVAPLAHPSSTLPSQPSKTNAPVEMTIGKKEPTGFLRNAPNNQTFPDTPFDSSHFTTHYKSLFCQHGEKLKSSRTPAAIITKMDSGYSRQHMDRFILRG